MKIVPVSSWMMEKGVPREWRLQVLTTSTRLRLYSRLQLSVNSCQYSSFIKERQQQVSLPSLFLVIGVPFAVKEKQ